MFPVWYSISGHFNKNIEIGNKVDIGAMLSVTAKISRHPINMLI